MRFFNVFFILFYSFLFMPPIVSAGNFIDVRPVYEGGDKVIAPPSPIRIDDFGFSYRRSPHTAEESVQLEWRRVSFAEEYRVYRQKIPLVIVSNQSGTTTFSLPDSSIVSPNGWFLLRTLDFNNANMFLDKDVPAVDMSVNPAARRPLGMAYCYQVKASGNGQEAKSPIICTRLRGINTPITQSVTATSPNRIGIVWEDRSNMELGYKVTYRQSDGGAKQTVTLLGADRRRFILDGLLPNTEYCLSAQTFDYYGLSEPDSMRCAKTEPLPDTEPEDKTFTLQLQRQDIYEGKIPYEGRFPIFDSPSNGVLKKVRGANGYPFLRFVKPGHDTGDCDQPNATVQLNPGEELSTADMQALYGSETPALPIYFYACAGPSTQLYDRIPINLTYQND